MARSVCSFTVQYVGIRLRVRLVPTVQDVWRIWEHLARDPLRRVRVEDRPLSFFCPALHPASKHWGTIILLHSPRLYEHVPHEVVHAVFSYFDQTINPADEEEFASAAGVLSQKIFKKLQPYLDT